MKKVFIILTTVLLTLSSCDRSTDDDCGCIKQTFKRESYICFDPTTQLPRNCYEMTLIGTEQVLCQIETETGINSDGIKYIVTCNN